MALLVGFESLYIHIPTINALSSRGKIGAIHQAIHRAVCAPEVSLIAYGTVSMLRDLRYVCIIESVQYLPESICQD